MSADDFIVTPWHVEGDIDYDKFMNILEWERDDEQNMDNTNFNL